MSDLLTILSGGADVVTIAMGLWLLKHERRILRIEWKLWPDRFISG